MINMKEISSFQTCLRNFKHKIFLNYCSHVVIEWLTLLFQMQKVSGPNLGPDNAYPDWDVSWFSPVFIGNSWDSNQVLITIYFKMNV